MAITIDGTANTITNLAAGGLPDNSVDNGTMADDAIGVAELSATGTASSSTFLRGDNAWAAPPSGLTVESTEENTYGGTNAGEDITSATRSTLIGFDAGKNITEGGMNTAIGRNSLATITTGAKCTAIGNGALATTTVGEQVAVGHDALYNQSSGDGKNTAIGFNAGNAATTAKENIYIGYHAGKSTGGADTGYRNVAIGYYAQGGGTTVSGNHNVGCGNGTWEDLTTGNGNTAFGSAAGSEVSTGDYNVLIGHLAGVGGSPSGNVNTHDGIVCLGDNNISNFYCADTSISSSDERDKADITDFTAGLGWIKALRPVTYRWDKRDWYYTESDSGTGKITRTAITKDGSKKKNKQHVGFVAQEVLAVEQANGFAANKDNMLTVHLNEDDTAYGMKYERLVPILVNAIKELSTEVDTLKTKVAALEAG